MRRPGFTLIELITVMAVMFAVIGITVVMFVQLFDYQRNHDEYSERMRTANRFVADFRSDVRTYGKPEILSDGTLLRWTTETATIEYTVQPGEFPNQLNVVRTVRKEGEQNRYETYHLPDRSTLRFVDGTDNDAGLIALSLWIAPKSTETPNLDELNPFDRTIPEFLELRTDPRYASNWRTIIVRY